LITDLGTLPGDVSSFAFGINNKGLAVGLGSRAFLWQNGVMTDLNAFVPGPPFSPLYLLQGFYIDDGGKVAGLGLAITGELHAFLATPCGEDSPDTKGCNADAGGTGAITPSQPAPVASGAAPVTPGNPRPGVWVGGMLDRPHVRQFPGRHFPGSTTGPTN
jgi:probable HAF family extracellular repeat protein